MYKGFDKFLFEICPLQARTHFARPNWKNVFSRLAATHNEKRIGKSCSTWWVPIDWSIYMMSKDLVWKALIQSEWVLALFWSQFLLAGVFYCGPMALAKELELLSRTFSQKSTTKFEFHKESFWRGKKSGFSVDGRRVSPIVNKRTVIYHMRKMSAQTVALSLSLSLSLSLCAE